MRKAIVPDAHLFEASMRDVKPLKAKRRARAVPKPAQVITPVVEKPIIYTAKSPRGLPPSPKPAAAPKPQAPGLDGSTERKLTRGLLEIDASIDLHGMTQAQAHTTLDRFVGRHVNQASRVLLVVTGKGKGGDGVLKRLMPEWLMAGPYASRILRIVTAARGHGGGGAFYVLLRRKR
ncbi:MAG: Smr/MutS family protein [Alphaproteobacteria bacterium]|nr:Smr/MutS family protein [Alphaproteobacteria bacterium]MCA0448389.1 Smr/MutS family protein [Pseudomonadota bacterium]